MYARGHTGRLLLPFALLWGTSVVVHPVRAQLIEGIDAWSDATIGLRASRWAGPRVQTPIAEARPPTTARIDARALPISVHAVGDVAPARLALVRTAAEQAHVLLSAAGFLTSFGDAGQGGTPGRDLYVQQTARVGARAALDASDNFSSLDGGRAFIVIDARLPSDRIVACTARAMVEAQLLELDPAEAPSLRTSSAAALASLFTGELTCDEPERETPASASPFAPETLRENTRGAALLRDLSVHEDGGRGTFLFDMWQFARQRTWEGRDLRASPDVIEAISKALSLAHDDFGLIAARILDEQERADIARGTSTVRRISIEKLPFATKEHPVALLGSGRLLVTLAQPLPGRRLRVWARSEPGAGFALAATRLDAHSEALMRVDSEPQADARSQLSVELDDATHAVLISATNIEDGTPDFDLEPTSRLLAFTVDLAP